MVPTLKVLLASAVVFAKSRRPAESRVSHGDSGNEVDAFQLAVDFNTPSSSCTTPKKSDWVVWYAGNENDAKCFDHGVSPKRKKCLKYAKKLWPNQDFKEAVSAPNNTWPMGCSRVDSTLYYAETKGKGAGAIPICIKNLRLDARRIAKAVNQERCKGEYGYPRTPVCPNLAATKAAWDIAMKYKEDWYNQRLCSTSTNLGFAYERWHICFRSKKNPADFLDKKTGRTWRDTLLNAPVRRNIGYARVANSENKTQWVHIAFLGCTPEQLRDNKCGCEDGCDDTAETFC